MQKHRQLTITARRFN